MGPLVKRNADRFVVLRADVRSPWALYASLYCRRSIIHRSELKTAAVVLFIVLQERAFP